MSTHLVLGAGPVGMQIATRLTDGAERVGIVSRRGAGSTGAITLAADLLAPAELAAAATRQLGPVDVIYFAAQPAYTRWPEEFPALHHAAIELAESLDAVLVAVENLYGYGPVEVALHEGLPLAATTRKGSTRAAMSEELFAAHESGRIRATAGRASDFFGPRVAESALGALFFGSLLGGGGVPVLSASDQPHSWTYIVDLADALIRLGSDERALGHAWHVPCVGPLTIGQMAARAGAIAGPAPVDVQVMTSAEVRAVAEQDALFNELAEMLYSFEAPLVVDDSAYRTTFGGAPTDVDVALADTIRWFTGAADRS